MLHILGLIDCSNSSLANLLTLWSGAVHMALGFLTCKMRENTPSAYGCFSRGMKLTARAQ